MASKDQANSIWDVGVYDAHCHPTDIMSATPRITGMKARVLTIMATRAQDQDLVAEVSTKHQIKDTLDSPRDQSKYVVPSFGWHPWFSHQIFDDRSHQKQVDAHEHYKSVLTPSPDDEQFLMSLPSPKPLSELLKETEERLLEFPHALVGEIGIDRAFRVPKGPDSKAGDITVKTGGPEEGEFTPGSREGRPLTPYRVQMEHQKMVLRAQLELAARLQRAVSVHSVQAHGVVFDLLQNMWKGHERPSKRQAKRQKDAPNTTAVEGSGTTPSTEPAPFPRRICMHSYSGPKDGLRQFLAPTVPADIYFSFSELINFDSPASKKGPDSIEAVPDHRVLIESDLHCAGERMDGLLEEVIRRVCEIKGWNLTEGAQILKQNWHRFVFDE